MFRPISSINCNSFELCISLKENVSIQRSNPNYICCHPVDSDSKFTANSTATTAATTITRTATAATPPPPRGGQHMPVGMYMPGAPNPQAPTAARANTAARGEHDDFPNFTVGFGEHDDFPNPFEHAIRVTEQA
ncbi:hypothetical protein CDAR_70162 [Caerostris darwini]|uniref:Uncharacterized protein n=1 Tax=Caerostris darwini TaxID=1538125 RepID=A0AAV4NU66_9ARAC|nr:hypothetical protein CDAR_70162 [Caerostris darwini]